MTDRALLVAMPLRHLRSASELAEDRSSVVLPAGGIGDLDEATTGTDVLVIATDAGAEEVPAVTWRATFGGRVAYAAGDPWPEGVPATWLEEHEARPAPSPPGPDDEGPDDDDDDDDDDDAVQSFFEVRSLAPVPRADWIFTNELVPKQQRGGRTFVPRTPRLIRFVD